MEKRVAVIGLDGMAWHILNKLFEYDAMPALKRISKNSLRGVLQSTVPPRTPPAWTSIASGVNPGKHGVFDWSTLTRNYETRILTSRDVHYPRLHEMVALKGLKSVCINQTLTYPIVKIRNTMVITDWASPRYSWHPKLLDKYAKTYSPYIGHVAFTKGQDLGKYDLLDVMLKETIKRVNAVNSMMEELDWRVFWAIYSEPDHIFHDCYDAVLGGEEPALRIFEKIDETIKHASKLSDLLLIISDHGFSKFNYAIYVNRFLDRLGLVTKTSKEKISRPIDDEKMETGKTQRVRIPSHLYDILSNIPSMFETILLKIYKMLARKGVYANLLYVDPRKSKAFFHVLGIHVKDRRLVDFIVDELDKIDCLGQVWRREEIYQGDYVEHAPDIIVSPDSDKGYMLRGDAIPPKAILRRSLLWHHPDGIVIAHSNQTKAKWIGEVSAVDVVPTILNYLGLPLPTHTDGKHIQGFPATETSPKTYNYLNHWLLTKKISSVKAKLAGL